MAKYFVQSGTLRTTVQAESSRKAALWAVHQAMRQVLPIDDCDTTSASSKSESAACAGVSVMDEVVRVSQHGFDVGHAATLSTMDVVREWNEMFTTLDRLSQLLSKGGIAA